jgi:DNA replication protein DnaC
MNRPRPNANPFACLEELIANAPEQTEAAAMPHQPRDFSPATGIPLRYRPEWERPRDIEWISTLARIWTRVETGGIVVLIGPRGSGKTRMAVEVMRSGKHPHWLWQSRYTTAMGTFLAIRSSWRSEAAENNPDEREIIERLATAPVLTIDEMGERGDTPWEDRIITHLIDRRYGDLLPTILIANLTIDALPAALGDSICSRIQETGGIIRIDGPSHRTQP